MCPTRDSVVGVARVTFLGPLWDVIIESKGRSKETLIYLNTRHWDPLYIIHTGCLGPALRVCLCLSGLVTECLDDPLLPSARLSNINAEAGERPVSLEVEFCIKSDTRASEQQLVDFPINGFIIMQWQHH